MQFTKASKSKAKLRLALIGPSGSGKTYSALSIAANFPNHPKIAVIDTEFGSASKYADEFEFDTLNLTDDFSPMSYVKAIEAARGYDILIIDSLSHAWMGKGGALEMVDAATKKSKSGNSYMAWRDVTPEHNKLVQAILQCPAHVIVTVRSKTEYVIDEQGGKKVPRKVGMAPVQRDGLEYEMDIACDLTLDHDLVPTKTRCKAIDGKVYHKPGKEFAQMLSVWLSDGADAPPSAIEVARELIRSAATLADLAAVWTDLGDAAKQACVGDKDARKAQLQEAANVAA